MKHFDILLPLPLGIGIYTTIMYNETRGYSSHKRPLLLERVGVRRIKSTCYIPLIPTFSLKGERSEGSGAKLLNCGH